MDRHAAGEDLELIARLQQLDRTPARDPAAEQAGRFRFLAEARTLKSVVAHSPRYRFRGWLADLRTREIRVMQRRLASAYSLAIAALIVTVVLGSTVATAYAAQGALPGSALHPLKTGLERVQFGLSPSAASRASLSLGFAEKRLEEMAGLIEAGRFGELPPVVGGFEAHIQIALAELNATALDDPAQAQRVALAIAHALSRYADLLMDFSTAVPAQAQAPLLQALNTSTQGLEIEFVGTVREMDSGSWLIERLEDGSPLELTVNENTEIEPGIALGGLVKVEAIQDASGGLWAVEIEPAEAGPEQNGDGQKERQLEDSENEGSGAGEIDQEEVDHRDDDAAERDEEDTSGSHGEDDGGDEGDNEDDHGGEDGGAHEGQEDNGVEDEEGQDD